MLLKSCLRHDSKERLMSVVREPLPKGTIIRLPDGFCAEITGETLGEGGGSLIYPAVRIHIEDGHVVREPMHLALKECFPISEKYRFRRDETGCIIPWSAPKEGAVFLDSVASMLRQEADITRHIYNISSRMIPVLETASEIELSDDAVTFRKVKNTVTVMESLTGKGVALRSFIRENRKGVCAHTALRIIEQVLYALREVHEAGYLHLDIQDGNVFLKGNLKDASLQAALIDFGSARPCLAGGLTAPVADKVLFTTRGFSAPEMRKNDGSLRLGPAADIFSAGYLLLLLLTGKRYELETISGVQGKNVLTPLRMRHTGCPAFLEGSLQDILRRSLAIEPGARYSSAAGMLADVIRLREALEPQKSSLHAVRYDAFICYRHSNLDTPAVKTLQNTLEHFPIPAEIRRQSGKKRFERIFTDLGELSGCADLGSAIQDALAGSEWLIVVCSGNTPESHWVSQEIETFLESHDRSRIIPVLIEGEPNESFPEEIRPDPGEMHMMLAADARARTKEEMIRIIKKDTVLRVAAPMLGVSYDSLKQRRRTYVMQRAAAVAASAAVLMAGFTAHTLYQSARIRAAHRETLARQGELLAKSSEELLQQGDRMGAIRAALEALPDSSHDTSKPVTNEAVYALNRATYAYWDSAFACFQSDCLLTPDTSISGTPSVSQDSSCMAVKDSAGRLYLYDLVDMRLKGSYTLADIYTACAGENLSEIRFLSDERLLLRTDSHLLCWFPEDENLIWHTGINPESGDYAGNADLSLLVIDDDRQRFYIMLPYGSDENRHSVYPILAGDLKTGELLDELDIPVGEDDLHNLQKGALSEDGRLLVIGLSSNMDERPCCLMGIDLEKGDILWKKEIGKDVDIRELVLLNDCSAAVLTEKADYENSTKISCLKCLSLDNGSVLYEDESHNFYLQHQGLKSFHPDDGTDPVLALWQENHLKLLNAASFLLLQEYQLPAPVLTVTPYKNNTMIAACGDGSIWRVYIDSRLAFFSGSVEGTFSDACAFDDNNLHLLLSGYSSNRLIAMSEHDYEGFSQPDIGVGGYVAGVIYMNTGDDWYRILSVETQSQEDPGAYLTISPAGSNEMISMTDSIGYKTPIQIHQTASEPALYYLLREGRGDDLRLSLCAWGIKSNALLGRSEDLPNSFSLCQICASDAHIILCHGNELLIFSADGSRPAAENLSACKAITLQEGQSIQKVTTLPDGSGAGFLVQIHTRASENRKEETLIERLEAAEGKFAGPELTLGPDANLLAVSPDGTLAVFREDTLFVIRDLVSGSKVDSLPEACSTKARAYFMDDRHLLIWGDSGYLKSWDLSQREIVMTDDTELTWISKVIKDGEYLQIQTQSLNEDVLFSRHSTDPGTRVYKYKEDGSFAHYFDFATGIACMRSGELTSLGTNTGIAQVMDLDQLIRRAKEILDKTN